VLIFFNQKVLSASKSVPVISLIFTFKVLKTNSLNNLFLKKSCVVLLVSAPFTRRSQNEGTPSSAHATHLCQCIQALQFNFASKRISKLQVTSRRGITLTPYQQYIQLLHSSLEFTSPIIAYIKKPINLNSIFPLNLA
jgi:hypothetical protein